jgi:hypothetical protein
VHNSSLSIVTLYTSALPAAALAEEKEIKLNNVIKINT